MVPPGHRRIRTFAAASGRRLLDDDHIMKAPVQLGRVAGVVAVDASADVRRAVSVFASHPVRRLPVVDGHDVVGMLTVDDLLVAFGHEINELTTGITAQLLFGHAEPAPPAVPA
jgi:CBS domain containing-hemolysin-like protein